jgi:predicted dehydrogenase
MPPPSRVRIAIIGQGHIGQAHVSAVRDVPSAVLACIVDPYPPAAGAASVDQCAFFTSIDEMLQDATMRIDAAIVCTPDHTHVEFSKQLLQAGIHVLCEKPICTDVSGGLELVC